MSNGKLPHLGEFGTLCYSRAKWAYPSWAQPLGPPDEPAGTGWLQNNVNWYTNNVQRPQQGAHTIPGHMITYYSPDNFWMYNPWGAPGTTVNDDRSKAIGPCGVLMRPNGEGHVYQGIFDARDQDFQNRHVTQWMRGGIVEAAWAISANHGGGYTYRLCHITEASHRATSTQVTEHCFQNTPPPAFFEPQSYIQDGSDTNSRKTITAYRTTIGTFPAGSMWTRNPIPAWKCTSGGLHGYVFDGITPQPDTACRELNFPPPINNDAYYGFGGHRAGPQKHLEHTFGFHIIDRLYVPPSLPLGVYALQWRWDCEATTQIWAQCSFVNIVDKYTVSAPWRLYDNETVTSDMWGGRLGRSMASHSATAAAAMLAAMAAMVLMAAMISRRRSKHARRALVASPREDVRRVINPYCNVQEEARVTEQDESDS